MCPCMETWGSRKIASATTPAEISGCERTVPTLPSKAEISADTNWKKLESRNEKKHEAPARAEKRQGMSERRSKMEARSTMVHGGTSLRI